MGKAGGDAKREEEGECSERGRPGYIDEGRARRVPRDHTAKGGRAKPGWEGTWKQKATELPPSQFATKIKRPGKQHFELRPDLAGAPAS